MKIDVNKNQLFEVPFNNLEQVNINIFNINHSDSIAYPYKYKETIVEDMIEKDIYERIDLKNIDLNTLLQSNDVIFALT